MLFLVSLLFLFTAVLGELSVRHLPHQAFIRQHNSENRCGATLIAPQWLLTAEHCLQHRNITEAPIDVYLGVSQEAQIDYWDDYVKRRVVRYILGPRVEIGNRTQESGLLLLKLDEKVQTSDEIKPIELPEVGTRWRANQTAVVSGIGWVYPWDEYDHTLRSLKVSILSKSRCLAIYRRHELFREDLLDYRKYRPLITPESKLCAFAEESHKIYMSLSGAPLAVCATPLRDTSGGQLLCKDNRWLLAGVAVEDWIIHKPGNIQYADLSIPTLYANVPVFTEWIRRTMQNN